MAITYRNRKGRKTVHKRSKQRIGKKGKSMRRHRYTKRRVRGGAYTGVVENTNDFASYYIVKSAIDPENLHLADKIPDPDDKTPDPDDKTPNLDDKTPNLVDKYPIKNREAMLNFGFKADNIKGGSVLWVIDMQNDFLDIPNEKLNGPDIPGGKIGAFAVTDGKDIVNKIIEFINKHGTKFKKIIFTRDFHPEDHCSFGSKEPTVLDVVSGYESKFPQHCLYNSYGADINPDIKKYIKFEDNTFKWTTNNLPIDIIFKGHHSAGDSFGAVSYPNDDYLNRRQTVNVRGEKKIGGRKGGDFLDTSNRTVSCCQGKDCDGLTGGVKLNAANYSKSNEEVIQGVTDEISFEAITESYGITADNLPDGDGEVYIIGLAGEFCVKDTAINLRKYCNSSSDEKIKHVKINVIQDLTRYAFVPIFLSFQRYAEDGTLIPFGEWKHTQNENKLSPSVFNIDRFKPLSLYLFKYPVIKDNKAIAQRLKLNTSPTGATIDYDESTNINLSTDISAGAMGDKIWHFTMDQNDLIRDYVDNKITLCMSKSKDEYYKIQEQEQQQEQ
jgi:nicotinamidase-related amidase